MLFAHRDTPPPDLATPQRRTLGKTKEKKGSAQRHSKFQIANELSSYKRATSGDGLN